MRLLLDTHVFLWWREENARLAVDVSRAIAQADAVYVSAASAWEAAIKSAIGKLRIPGPMAPAVEESGFSQLGIEFRHAEVVAMLPLHHRDPFDRMLIAQARVEGLTRVTHDRSFEAYRIPILWT